VPRRACREKHSVRTRRQEAGAHRAEFPDVLLVGRAAEAVAHHLPVLRLPEVHPQPAVFL